MRKDNILVLEWIGGIAPLFVLSASLYLWAVDVLLWDDWLVLVDMLERLRIKAFGLSDIILQENEHRCAIGRFIDFVLMPIFHCSRSPNRAITVAMAGVCLLFAIRMLRRTTSEGRDWRPITAFSMLTFSMLQWEAFSGGITTVMSTTLGVWLGAYLLWSVGRLSLGRVLGVALVGIVPAFSFASGLLYWPCLAPLVVLRAGSRRRAWGLTACWLGLGALTWWLYFRGYARPGHHPRPTRALDAPLSLIGYFLAYLGGALVGDKNLLPLAILAGGFALFALGTMALSVWRTGKEARDGLWPWLAVAGFSLATALITAFGRSALGLSQALESRYATNSTPLWLALVGLFFQYRHRLSERLQRWLQRGGVLCLLLFCLSSILAGIVLHNRWQRFDPARQELYSLAHPERLRVLFPDPAFLIANMPLLLEMHVGIYHDLKLLPDYRMGDPATGSFDLAPKAIEAGRVHGFLLTGMVPGNAGRRVIVWVPGHIVGMGLTNGSGAWSLYLPENALPAGPVRLSAGVLATDGRTLQPFAPLTGVDLDNPARVPWDFKLSQNFFMPGLPSR